MAWVSFQWGSRGLYWDTGLGVYVAHIFIPHAIQITLFGHDGRNDELLHTFHCATVDPLPSGADCAQAATTVESWVSHGVSPFVHIIGNTITVDRVVAQSIAEFEGPYAEVAIGEVGDRGAGVAPSVLTLNVKKHGDTTGRSHRGYFATWPPVVGDLDVTDTNLWAQGYVDDVLDVYNALMGMLGGVSLPLGIASRARGVMEEVTGLSVVTRAVRNRHTRAAGIGR